MTKEDGATISGLVNNETATVKGTGSITNVGTETNTYKINWGTAEAKNYEVKTEDLGTLEVTAKAINPDPEDEKNTMTIDDPKDKVYNGLDQKWEPEVKDGEKKLVKGTDYEVNYSEDVKNVGTVTVTITGKGNYTGEVVKSYKITKAPLAVKTLGASKVYDGTALTKEDGATISGLVNNETATVKGTGSITNVGTETNTYKINWGTAEEEL